MEEKKNTKDLWDKISSITPLILGIFITGVGILFTQIYNYQQLQLNRIQALDKLRSALISENSLDREFAYSAFIALGYEDLAIRLIQTQKDESGGRTVLTDLKLSESNEIKEQATTALKMLDASQKLVNKFEFGSEEVSPEILRQNPDIKIAMDDASQWANETAKNIGINSQLGIAVLYDAAVQLGIKNAEQIGAQTSMTVSPPLQNIEQEKKWLLEFLNLREKRGQRFSNEAVSKSISKRVSEFKRLVNEEIWDLKNTRR